MLGPDTIWVLIPVTALFIPITAIAADAFNKWMKFKDERRKLGGSPEELEAILETIKAELRNNQEALEQRVANLETIITSQTWDTLHDPALSTEEKNILVGGTRSELESLKQDVDDARKAEVLARRIR